MAHAMMALLINVPTTFSGLFTKIKDNVHMFMFSCCCSEISVYKI